MTGPHDLSPEAFRTLFREHASFVWRVLRRHGVDERELEDLCQEVFIVVHRKLPEYEGRGAMRTWLYGIAARVALNHRRRARVRREQLEAEPPERGTAATQAQTLASRQQLVLLERALAKLTESKRESFVLYELEGMTMAEVGRALEIPEATVRSRIVAAREEIRAFVERHERDRQPTLPFPSEGVRP